MSSSKVLQPYYVAIAQVFETGKSLTISEANAVDYGMRPSIASIVGNLRRALTLFRRQNKEAFIARPLRIRQMIRSKCCVIELNNGPEKRYGRNNILVSYTDTPTTIFNSFYFLFESSYLKGEAHFTNCCDRLLEIAAEKKPTKCSVTIKDTTVIISL